MKTRPGLFAAILIALPLALSQAYAAGGGGGGGGGGGESPPPPPKCKAGQVYDQKKQKCVKSQQGMIDDESIFETGRALAYAGRFDEAIDILSLAKNPEDPGILNMLGYSNRKLGRLLVGLGYYEEALKNNPDYVLAREYLGEAHLQMGDLDSAKVQLSEIEKRRGKNCDEYAALSARIADYVSKGG